MDSPTAEEFVRVFAKSQHRILGFIHTLIPNIAEAEEILQETSVILWKKWPEFDRDRDFVRWACGIARFEIFRMLRQRQRDKLYLSEEVLSQVADIALLEASDRMTIEDTKAALGSCLQELPEFDSHVLNLRYQKEMTVMQISQECERPKSTIHDLLGKIRARLLRCVRRRLGA